MVAITMTRFAELSQEDRDAVECMDLNTGLLVDDVAAVAHTAPPGEEGFNVSHEGGEYEVFDDLVDGLAQSNGQFVDYLLLDNDGCVYIKHLAADILTTVTAAIAWRFRWHIGIYRWKT